MKNSLVKTYVALRLAQNDLIFAEVQKKTTRAHFIREVMKRPICELPDSLQRSLKATLEKRGGAQAKVSLGKPSTIGRWVSELTGQFDEDDILSFFAEKTGIAPDEIAHRRLHGQTVTRPYLISMVEALEKATNHTMDEKVLDVLVTFRDLAKFFAKPAEIYKMPVPKPLARREEQKVGDMLLRKKALLSYRRVAEIKSDVSDEVLLETPLMQIRWEGYKKEKDWELPIFFAADEFDVLLPLPEDTFNQKSTVKDLIDLMVSRKKAEQKKLQSAF